MPRDLLEDLTEHSFGDIKPVKYIGKKYWLCKCICGEQIKIRKSSLNSYYKDYKCTHTESLLSKALKKPNFIDISNMKFGDFTVDKYAGHNKWTCICKCGYIHQYESKYIRKNLKNFKCNHLNVSKDKKFIDLTDSEIGDLHIEKYLGDRKWECTCKCGKTVIRDSYSIRNKNTMCNHNVISVSSKFIDMAGLQIGDMTVVQYIGNSRWLCKCKCGHSFSLDGHDIRRRVIDYRCTHLTGQRFGRLKVVNKLDGRKYLCQCDCGSKPFEVLDYNLKYGHTKSCGCFRIEHQSPLLTKEQVEEKLSNYTKIYGEKPMLSEVFRILNVSYSTSINYINNYKLHYMLDSRFKSNCEKELYNLLINEVGFDNILVGVNNIIHNNYENELDFYIPEINTAIEFNGAYWHSDIYKDKYYHQRKTLACAKQGIRLIHIFEYELYFDDTRDKIIDILLDLKKSNRRVIYARKTYVTELHDCEEIRRFLDLNHLQGYSSGSVNIALIDKSTDDIVGMMTFGTPRFNSNYDYEIIRMCFKRGITVVGGAEKMFKFFLETYNPQSVITYCDISKFTGNTYTKLGFTSKNDCITEPNYKWVDMTEQKVLSRYQTQKHKLITNGLGDESETENEIMHRLGFLKIFDSGNIKLEWSKSL